jgi:hypothetical protein
MNGLVRFQKIITVIYVSEPNKAVAFETTLLEDDNSKDDNDASTI